MPLYAGLYNYHDNEEARQKREAVADRHIDFFGELVSRNLVVLGTVRGDDDPPGGEIVIKAPSREAALDIFKNDPNTAADLGNWMLTEFRPVGGLLNPAFQEVAES